MPHRLFLSHAGVDSEAALALVRRLEDAAKASGEELVVWVDKTDLGPGPWLDQIDRAFQASTAFAVYVGSRGVVNWVWREVKLALDRTIKEPAYPLLPVLAPGTRPEALPSFLAQFQAFADAGLVEPAFATLLAAVLGRGPRAQPPRVTEPFVGLSAYDSRKAHLFFGREEEIDALVDLLRAENLVLVTGDSGSGKSSLVKAGLVPAFRGGRLTRPREQGPDDTVWHVVETRPGGDPFARLADDLRDAARAAKVAADEASRLAGMVRKKRDGTAPDPGTVRDALLSSLPPDLAPRGKLLLVVDQFEEFRTAPDAAAYADALVRLAEPGDERVRVVLTMRRDYVFACDGFPALRDRLAAHGGRARVLLRRMSREHLREAVVKPLELAGVDARERENLAEVVANDAGDEPGELALVQFALTRTWQERHQHGGDLLSAYRAIGRVEGALAKEAERVFRGLAADAQRRTEALFVRLVRAGETGGVTRRIARLDEFDAASQALAQKLAGEEHARLLSLGEGTVEIAHEQLATQWSRYQQWINNVGEDRRGDDLRLLHGLIAEATAWQRSQGRERRERLARGYELEAYRSLAARRPTWFAPVERAFLAESGRAAWSAAAQRWGAIAALIALTLATGAFAWFANEGRKAAKIAEALAEERARAARVAEDRAEERALAARVQLLAVQARRVEAEADTPEEIELAYALALESIQIARDGNRPIEADAVETARNALVGLPDYILVHGDSPVQDLTVLADGRLASVGYDGLIKLWPTDGRGEPEVLDQGDSPDYRLAALPDGRLASGGFGGLIKLWPTDGTGVYEVFDHGDSVNSLAVLADGRLASGGADGLIKVWPTGGRGEPTVFVHGNDRVNSLAVLTDGRLASGGADGLIKLWPKDGRGEPTVFVHGNGWVNSLAVLADGRLASGGTDRRIKAWPTDGTGVYEVLDHGGSVTSLAVLADGRLASGGGNDDQIKLWPKDGTGEPTVLVHGTSRGISPVEALAMLADGRLASGGDDGRIKIWSTGSAGEPAILDHGSESVNSLAALADGRLASSGGDGLIKLWRTDGIAEPIVLVHGSEQVELAVLADGRLASGGRDGRIKLWRTDGIAEPTILVHGSEVWSLAVLPDGRLASGGRDGRIKLWRTDGIAEPTILVHGRLPDGRQTSGDERHGSEVWSLAALPDGRLASGSGDGLIKLWRTDGIAEPTVLVQDSEVWSLAALPDGRLASGSGDGLIKLWRTDGIAEPIVLVHGSEQVELAVLPDGRLTSSDEENGQIKLWPKAGTGEPVTLNHGDEIYGLVNRAGFAGGWFS